MTRLNRAAIGILLVGMAPLTFSATLVDACQTMTNKLAVIYHISAAPDRFDPKSVPIEGVIKKADYVVAGAYGELKENMDAQWAGFHDWSTLTVLKAISKRQTSDELRKAANLSCLKTFRSQ